MHYRVTVLILLTSSGIGVAKQYFGDPINCQVNRIVLQLSGPVEVDPENAPAPFREGTSLQ